MKRLNELPIGSYVIDEKNPELVWLVAAQDHPGYGGTTLLAEKVIGVRCFDAMEPDRVSKSVFEGESRFGSNDYASSNIHQWLNSGADEWYDKKSKFDCGPEKPYLLYNEQPYMKCPGFLTNFSETFITHLLEVPVQVLKRVEKDTVRITNIRARVFLPSRTELGKGDENGNAEGKIFPIMYHNRIYKTAPLESELKKHGRSWNPGRENAPYDAPQIYDPKYGWWYWMRTPSAKYSFLLRVASPFGAVSYTYANNDIVGVRPVVNLDENTFVRGNGKARETFTICQE